MIESGASGTIRTCDLRFRRPALSSTELPRQEGLPRCSRQSSGCVRRRVPLHGPRLACLRGATGSASYLLAASVGRIQASPFLGSPPRSQAAKVLAREEGVLGLCPRPSAHGCAASCRFAAERTLDICAQNAARHRSASSQLDSGAERGPRTPALAASTRRSTH